MKILDEDESYIRVKNWKWCMESKPIMNVLVLVFRKRKYIIAECKLLKNEDEHEEMRWITQHGNSHKVDDDDLWLEFEHVRIEKIFC